MRRRQPAGGHHHRRARTGPPRRRNPRRRFLPLWLSHHQQKKMSHAAPAPRSRIRSHFGGSRCFPASDGRILALTQHSRTLPLTPFLAYDRILAAPALPCIRRAHPRRPRTLSAFNHDAPAPSSRFQSHFHQENRSCLRSTVVFRWETLGAPGVSCSGWSLWEPISLLCEPLSVSGSTWKNFYSPLNTLKATRHSPVHAGGFT